MNSIYVSTLVEKQIWQDFIAHFKSETTAASYQTDIAEVMNYFQKDFLQIGKTDAAQYFLYLRERADLGKIQYGTVAKKLRELHSFSAYICENRKRYGVDAEFQDWFSEYLKYAVKQEKYVKSIPIEHMDRLLEAAKEDEMAYTILVLLYRVGLTSSEIVSLKRDDFAVYGNEVFVSTDRRKDDCFIPADVSDILEHYIKEAETSEYLFVNRRGNPLNLMYISRMMKKYTTKAGIPSYSAESIRNTCGVTLFAYGAQPEQAAAQMGITQIQIHRYRKLSYREQMMRAAGHLVKVKVLPPDKNH